MKSANKKATKTKAAKAPKAPRAPRIEKNGVARPGPDGKTGQVWAIADKLNAKGETPSRATVIEAAGKAGIDSGTAATQYGYWRKFNGIKGRIGGAPKAPKAPKAKAAKKPATPKPPKAPAAPAAPKPPAPPAAPAASAS